MRDGKTVVEDVPTPLPRPGCALVRTASSLVSAGTERMLVEFGEKNLLEKARSRPDLVRQVLDKARREGLLSTLEATFNRLDQPMPLGYSSAGTIHSIGEELQGFNPGDRVACAGGNYAVHAEVAVVPQNLLAPIPPGVDFESAAFATVGAIALHGFRLAQAQVGESVLVIGLGLLGLLAAQIARAAGCSVFGVDLDPNRVALAKKLGFSAATRNDCESAGKAFSQGRGFDAVLICADTQADDPVALAGLMARDRARVIAVGAVGLNLPRKVYYEKELYFQVSRSYGPGRYDPEYEEKGHDYPPGFVRWTEGRNISAFLDLLARGLVDVHPLISHRFPIERGAEAYSLITGKKKEPYLGVVLTYPQEIEITSLKKIENKAIERKPAPGVEKLALGVLGAGNYATAVFLPAVVKTGGTERVGIASAAGLSARHASQRYGFAYASSDENEILTDPNINVVVILTRHQHHARQVLAALRQGKHVYCEKPLAITRQELEEIEFALSTDNGPLLTVGFNRRFAPMAMKLKQFLSSSGEPLAMHYRINAGYLPPTHWLHDPGQGGGRIIGEGCHFIDFLSFLVGASPSKVTAEALPDCGHYRQDNVRIDLSFPDGSLGTVTYLANGDKAFTKERVEVFSNGRVAVLDDFRTLELVHDGRRQVIHSRLRQDKGHANAWAGFLEAVRRGGPPPIPYMQLIGVTQATFAAVENLNL
jgi:predicted dehydrogenase